MTTDSTAQRNIVRRDNSHAVPDDLELRDLRDFFENAPISMHWIGPDGTILRANSTVLAFFGYAADEFVGHNLAEFHADRDVILDILSRLTSGEEVHNEPARVVTRDGSIRHVLIDSSVLRDADGNFLHTRCCVRPDSERWLAEQRLARQSDLLEQTHDAVLVWGLESSGIEYWNRGAEHMYGYPAAEAVGRATHELLDTRHPGGREAFDAALVRDGVWEGELTHCRRDGSRITVESHHVLVTDAEGRRLVLETTRDITERKRAETALVSTTDRLRESEERYRTLAESMPVMVATKSPDGVADYHNARWLQYTGMSSDDLRERWQETVHPDDLQALAECSKDAIASKTQMETEYRLRRHDGQYRWHRFITTPVLRGGEPALWIDASADIHERKSIERERDLFVRLGEALSSALDVQATAEAIARAVVPEFADGAAVDVVESDGSVTRLAVAGGGAIAAIGPTGVLQTCTPHFDADATGHGALIAVPISVRGEVCAALTFTAAGEHRFDQRDVGVAHEIARRSAHGLANARLFDELQATAEHLALANAAKDEFLGLVSHELRTPITTIYGNARVLRQQGDLLDEADREAALADVENESDRLQRIIENLLILARFDATQTIETEPVDLKHAARQVVANFKRRRERRDVKLDIADDVGFVSVQPTYLELVLGNLLSNADKYSPQSAAIDLQARREGSEVHITVLDRGDGIMPDELEQLFSPFYRANRTSDHAPGMGIGLAVCKRILEAQGCRIWAKARDGGGAEFGFALPVEEPAE